MRDHAAHEDDRQHSQLERRTVERGPVSDEGSLPRRGAPLSPIGVLSLQRSVGNAGTAAYLAEQQEQPEGAGRSPIHETITGSGKPLDHGTRSTMEQHFGADFSDVRLHVDARSAESVQAAAYTVGNDIVVHPNHFAQGTPAAQRTLAHELTHVVQQRSGPVSGDPAPGGIRLSDPSDRFEREAERNATAFMSSSASSGHRAAGGSGDEADVQRITVQRESEADESEGEDE